MGIDPGFSGALAVLDDDLNLEFVMDMPIIMVGKKRELDESKLSTIFSRWRLRPMTIGIEKSQTMPNQGIVSSGRYMASYGFLRGLCVGNGLPYHLIRPQSWKKAMMPDMGKDKGASIQKVTQLYPELRLTRVKDHGIADAILIARYLRLNILDGTTISKDG
jgi:crossover junction endodeoxyribonuclease RuvC